jgi:hypothetical protein
MASSSLSVRTSIATEAPSFLASASRYGLTSVITMWRAPTWRAIATAILGEAASVSRILAAVLIISGLVLMKLSDNSA